MAVLLLDFDKTYDRVDVFFLKETMLCMSFLATWIWEIATMYMTNHKEVLLVGDRGDRFSISCFVC